MTQRLTVGRTRRQRWLVFAAVVIVVAMVLVTTRATSRARLEGWLAACQAEAGTVQTAEPAETNPLITQSKDPSYQCRGADGHVIDNWN